ncbi:MAG: sodium/solute symporter [Myxococcota bacterium]
MDFTPLDLVVFIGSLLVVMAAGLWASRSENSTEDYFLAGRTVRWWGVAGSIFGTNVSANHLVGMLGIGFSIGFAQSHFELGAVAALLVLCYGFLPVYRKLGLFTLSEYLGRRFDGRSQGLYAILMIILVMVQLTAAFYIGSRSLLLMLRGTPLAIGYETGIVLLMLVTAIYTIFGGLKAVVFTDVVQSVLLLAAGIAVAIFTFAQPEVGGWSGMMAQDAARAVADQKMHLYLPSDHPDLPWSGAITGLMLLHIFYWSTNQYVVQRTLAARDDREACLGIITAGFLKLLVPFFAIGGGVAASFLFQERLPGVEIDPDAAMPELIRLVIPVGYGLVGLIAAGILGAILSSIDSMVNSAATLITFDIYQKWLKPDASERQLLSLGRWIIALLLGLAAALAIFTYDAESKGNFFLRVSSMGGHFTPGLVVVFAFGMLWSKATAAGSVAAIVVAPPFSFALEVIYRHAAAASPGLTDAFGVELNFMHRVLVTAIFATLVLIVVSRAGTASATQRSYTIAAQRALARGTVRKLLGTMGLGIAILLGLGVVVDSGRLSPRIAAIIASILVFSAFTPYIRWRGTARSTDKDDGAERADAQESPAGRFKPWVDDRFWAAILSALTIFVMFEFF